MSAIKCMGTTTLYATVPGICDMFEGEESMVGVAIRENVYFLANKRPNRVGFSGRDCTMIAFEGGIPETLKFDYLDKHPEHLIECFSELEVPAHCEWMANSRIKSIVNHMGFVIVELEPAS